MTYKLQYGLNIELEMVWQKHQAVVAMGCVLWLNWFCMTERALEHICPASDIGHTTAMESAPTGSRRAVLMWTPISRATSSSTAIVAPAAMLNKASAVTDAENARVRAAVEVYNGKPGKRTWEDIVREKKFAEMKYCFTGPVGCHYAKGAGRRSGAHSERGQGTSQLCMSHKLFHGRGFRGVASRLMGLVGYMLKKESI